MPTNVTHFENPHFILTKIPSECYHIRSQDFSYSVFMINEAGDLSIIGDWGSFHYSWRAFGSEPFKKFVADLGMDYLISKLSGNYRVETGKKLPKHIEDNILNLCEMFQTALKKELNEKA